MCVPINTHRAGEAHGYRPVFGSFFQLNSICSRESASWLHVSGSTGHKKSAGAGGRVGGVGGGGREREREKEKEKEFKRGYFDMG